MLMLLRKDLTVSHVGPQHPSTSWARAKGASKGERGGKRGRRGREPGRRMSGGRESNMDGGE